MNKFQIVLRTLLQITFVMCFTTLSHAQKPNFKVVAFYTTTVEMDHVLFANDALYFLRLIASQNDFSFDATTDWTNLNDTYLGNYQVVVWLNDVPHTAEQK